MQPQFILYGLLTVGIIMLSILKPSSRMTVLERVLWVITIVVSAYWDPTLTILLSIGALIRVIGAEYDYLQKAFQRTESFEDYCMENTPANETVKEANEERETYQDEIREMAGITDANLLRIQGEFVEEDNPVSPCESYLAQNK